MAQSLALDRATREWTDRRAATPARNQYPARAWKLRRVQAIGLLASTCARRANSSGFNAGIMTILFNRAPDQHTQQAQF